MRSYHRRGAGLLFALCLPLTLLFGCSSGEPSAAGQLCDGVDELRAAPSELGDLEVSSSRAQVESSVDDLLAALGTVSDNLGAVVESDVGAIQDSVDSASAELEDLPSSASPGEAVASLPQAAVALQSALDQGLTGLDVDCDATALCGPSS